MRTAELERDSIFVIEKILGKKKTGNIWKYHIKWENYRVIFYWTSLNKVLKCKLSF